MSLPTAHYRLIAIALLTMSACAPRRAARSVQWGPPAGESITQLEVRNDQWDDLTVYLEREGARFRLGTVAGMSTRVLEVPPEYVTQGGNVRLTGMRPGARLMAASVPFDLARGQHVAWVAARTSGPTPVAVR
jgi:hypothetical protein